MKRCFPGQHGYSFLEYTALIVMIISAFIVMRYVIRQGFEGQMRRAGENFSYLRQYNPDRTIECAYELFPPPLGFVLYSVACYDHQVEVQGCYRQANSQACLVQAKVVCQGPCARQ